MSSSPVTSPREEGESAKKKGSGSFSYGGEWNRMIFNSLDSVRSALKKEVKLNPDFPCFVLGRRHEGEGINTWVELNVKSIQYFSYRNRIPKPLSNGADHDAGWGCMHRTGQMMLCEAVRRSLHNAKEIKKAVDVAALFMDVPEAPFSLHRMSDIGAKNHIPVGQWFSPTCLAYTVKNLVESCELTSSRLGVVISKDGLVSREEIIANFLEGRYCLVCIQILGGIEKIGAGYAEAVCRLFELSTSLGVVGGRPKHSLYFVGCQKDYVFFLDPHTVQPAYVSETTIGTSAGTRGTMLATEMDPSMMLCFLFTKHKEVEAWETELNNRIHPLTEYPMFSITKSKTLSKHSLSQSSLSPGSSSSGVPAAQHAVSTGLPASQVKPVPATSEDDFDDCS